MAKLGSLLLRGFTNAKKRRRQKARQGISVAQKNPGRFKKISSITKSRLSKASPESEDAKLLKDAVERNKQLNKQLKKQLSQQGLSKSNLPSVTIKPTASMSSGTELTSKELIRPDEKLLKSMEAFLRDQRSQHTKRAYGKDLKRFVKFLIGKDQTLDRALLISYKDSLLSEGLEHTTIDRHLATLRSFFRWLVDDGVITKSPVENVRFLNPRRESRTVGFTDEEVRKVLATPNLYTKIGSLHYAILMVLFFCGLRRSELCSIRTSHIGFERGHHYFRLQGKGNAERIVVMVEPVWKALKHYLIMSRKDIQVDQPLFSPVRNNRTQSNHKPLDSSMIFYIVTRYAKLAGVTNRVSPHSCRATAISNARDHNVPDRAIQEFAGWATTTMITRYDKRKSSLEKSAAHSISYGKDARDLPYIPASERKPSDS